MNFIKHKGGPLLTYCFSTICEHFYLYNLIWSENSLQCNFTCSKVCLALPLDAANPPYDFQSREKKKNKLLPSDIFLLVLFHLRAVRKLNLKKCNENTLMNDDSPFQFTSVSVTLSFRDCDFHLLYLCFGRWNLDTPNTKGDLVLCSSDQNCF